MVDFGGMLIKNGRRLSAEIAVSNIKIESRDAMVAVDAAELHPSGYAFSGVVSHWLDCRSRRELTPALQSVVEGNTAGLKLGAAERWDWRGMGLSG